MYDHKKYFHVARKEFIEKPLAEFGFKKYRQEHIARITDDNVLQLIRFHKSKYGSATFKVNVTIRPLYCPHPSGLPASPGNDLVKLSGTRRKKNEVWGFAAKEEADESFAGVYKLLVKAALPFFNATANVNDIIKAYERNLLGFRKFGKKVDWGPDGWSNYDFGHIYLRAGKLNKAKAQFDKYYKDFNDDGREWALELAAEFPHFMKLIYGPQADIDQYLADITAKNWQDMELDKWF
jgi:hypothetical protein